MKVLIFGNGFLGNEFGSRLSDCVITNQDITDAEGVRREIREHNPDAVLNCAGKTGKPNVDWCEDHVLPTLDSNTLGPIALAKACIGEGAFMAHLGSGCVYEGDNGGRGFSENDAPNFFGSLYSRSKMYSEMVLREFQVLQLRLRMPVDSKPGPRNLITKLAKYQKIISIKNSISVIDDFVPACTKLIERRRTGIYNVTNPGAIEAVEILDMYEELVDPSHKYALISLEELYKFTKAKRSNCVLNTEKIESEGIRMRPVKEAVRDCIVKYRQNLDDGDAKGGLEKKPSIQCGGVC
jgi:dTDP-4-dehydrorhamnose reductase